MTLEVFSNLNDSMIWINGHVTMTASFPVLQNWEVWLLCHRMENWADRNFMKLIKGKYKVHSWEATIPCSSTCLELPRWEATPQKRTLASWWTPSRMCADNKASCQIRPKSSWAVLGKMLPAGQGKRFLCFYWALVGSHGKCWVQSGLPRTRKTWTY